MGSVGERPDYDVTVYPEVVEKLAKDYPNELWVKYPRSSDLTQGWRDVTYKELGHAVDGFARWVEQKLGVGSGLVTDAVAYIGVNDLRYMVVQFGLAKAGYTAMLPSPRNSREGQESLLRTANVKAMLYSEGMDTHVDTIRDILPEMSIHRILSLDDVLNCGTHEGPYKGHYRTGLDDVAVILHTSGSTGLPKPIYLTNGFFTQITILKSMPAPKGRCNLQDVAFKTGDLMFNMSPLFHAMGGISGIARCTLHRAPLVMLPSDRPPNAELIVKVLQQTNPKSAIFAPSLLEQVADFPGGQDALANLDFIIFAGAPLAREVGDRISNLTTLQTLMGTTEAGVVQSLIASDKQDWSYFEWSPDSGANMQPNGDGLSELVLVKGGDRTFKGIFYTYPDLTEYRTKDLYEPHPTKSNLWRYAGRTDDVLVLSNGEKTNPVDYEKAVESHPLVHGALVIGKGRFQPGLLIEPAWASVPAGQGPEDLSEVLWPTIERANIAAQAHAQVWKSKVAIAKRDKPFKRAAKGSIIRRTTTELYHSEIEALYSNESRDEFLGTLGRGSDLPTITTFLRQIFKTKGLAIPEDAPDDADLFSFGVDSLQVLAISSSLSHALGDNKQKIVSPRVVYSNPTIGALAKYIQGLSIDNGVSSNTDREEVMKQMVRKYTRAFPTQSSPVAARKPNGKHSVILTGSTGSLGNYTLEELLAASDVDQIFCLNRSVDAESRQRSSFEGRGAKADFAKVSFLNTDFSKDRFGLSDDIYARLLETVDIFIHNAWTVDFNQSLESYEATHVAGTRRVVDFSLHSKHRAHIVFISSIASVTNYTASPEVPETLIDDYSLPIAQGYGESKHVASQILALAARRAGVSSTTVRAGQLAGPSREGIEWNRHEWLPSLVISSKAMGMLPEQLGKQDEVDWVPVDLAAKTVVETCCAAAGQNSGLAQVTHLVNPRIASWRDLVPSIQEAMQCEVLSFAKWIETLKQAPQTAEVVARIPGIKLVDFYEGLLSSGGRQVRLATAESVKVSETLSKMQPIGGELMQMWVRRWMQ